MSVRDVFQRIVLALDRAGIEYMLSGSFASAYYGAARSTQDIDLVIHGSPAQLTTFVNALPSNEYYADLDSALEAYRRKSMFNLIDLSTGWKIDLIVRKSRDYSLGEFARRTQVNLHGVGVFIATAEDAVISKLEWAKLGESPRQIEDVAAILRVRGDMLDRSYLENWISKLGLGDEWEKARAVAGLF